MDQIVWQLTEWRGEMAWALCAVLVYVATRCGWEATRRSGAARRRLWGCALGMGALAPATIYPALGIMPLVAALGLCFLASSATRRPGKTQKGLVAAGLVLLLGTSGMVSAGHVLNLSSGPSMWPTSPKGLSFLWILPTTGPIQRGQQVEIYVSVKDAAPDPDTGWPAGRYHKRVFALPGDRVSIEDYRIVVNNDVVADCSHHNRTQELPLYGLWLCNGRFSSGLTHAAPVAYQTVWGEPDIWMNGQQSWVVPQGMALVLGDNLVESGDSRQRGLIPLRWITHRVRSP